MDMCKVIKLQAEVSCIYHVNVKQGWGTSSSSSSVFYSTTIKVHRNNVYHDIRPKKR